ncbi:hypothetical protein ACVWZV_003410 [Bradyrhizobium sp. GM5.1]
MQNLNEQCAQQRWQRVPTKALSRYSRNWTSESD